MYDQVSATNCGMHHGFPQPGPACAYITTLPVTFKRKGCVLRPGWQVRLFSSRDLGSSLHVGDISVAVGWSGDLVPWAARSSNIVLIAPASGSMPAMTSQAVLCGGLKVPVTQACSALRRTSSSCPMHAASLLRLHH